MFFVCGWTAHFGCNCPDAQCFGSDKFSHFVQDCSQKIPPSGTPCHQGRSHSRHPYNHNWRDRLHSYYGSRHRRWYSRSQSCPNSCHERNSNFRRHTAWSSISHCSNSCCTSTDGCSHDPSCHICTPSHTWHLSYRHHSCHSRDQRWSCSSNSCHTTQEYQPRKVKQYTRPSTPNKPHCTKTVTIQDSHSDSSSDADSYSNPLNH